MNIPCLKITKIKKKGKRVLIYARLISLISKVCLGLRRKVCNNNNVESDTKYSLGLLTLNQTPLKNFLPPDSQEIRTYHIYLHIQLVAHHLLTGWNGDKSEPLRQVTTYSTNIGLACREFGCHPAGQKEIRSLRSSVQSKTSFSRLKRGS